MPAEAWVALAVGSVGIIVSIIGATWYLSARLSSQDSKMNNMGNVIEKMELVVAAIAVDRERAAAMERRMLKLEQWYDELRRGDGFIRPSARPT
jgi:hypothetical protein